MDSFVRVTECRACRSTSLIEVVSLGDQALTGVFPTTVDEKVLSGPLNLVWCRECTLVQLSVNYASSDLYGDNYGYRSGLNASMLDHLRQTSEVLRSRVELTSASTVLDIGSNDGSYLSNFADTGAQRIGIDPTAGKFRQHYQQGIEVVEDFFTSKAFHGVSSRPADLITTISMFYDLPDPVDFAKQVRDCLAPEGIWLLEQSYMPSMLRTTSYDTICHEHLEYYTLNSLNWILEQAELRIIDVRFNRINGGSFAVTVAHRNSTHVGDDALISWFAKQEDRMRFDTPKPLRDFEARVYEHRADLKDLVESLVRSGKRIAGLGASTKGNVLLQFCGFGPEHLVAIGDVNPEKDGKFTPGTGIPIVGEQEVRALGVDYFLVLPWHFREGIVARESEFLRQGGGLIFPLPEIEIVGG